MIESACNHWQPSAGLLVERPEAEIVAIEVMYQRSHAAREQFLNRRISGCERKIVDSPECPDEAIQNVRRRRDDVLFEPQVSRFIPKSNSAVRDRSFKTDK